MFVRDTPLSLLLITLIINQIFTIRYISNVEIEKGLMEWITFLLDFNVPIREKKTFGLHLVSLRFPFWIFSDILIIK